MTGLSRLVILILPGLGVCLPIAAHHSDVAFDADAELSFDGTISSFRLRNPHAYFFVDVVDEEGETIDYRVETETRNDLIRNGWNDDSLIPGDRVTVTVNPARDPGRSYGRLLSLIKSDGTVLNPPAEQDIAGRQDIVPAASLEGVWLPVQTHREMYAAIGLLVTDRARAERSRIEAAQAQPENTRCLNFAHLPAHLGRAHVFEIEFASDDLILIHGEDMQFPRQIHLDGRGHPEVVAEQDMSGMGHSVGHWDGDTLVIDTRHFRQTDHGNGMYPSGPRKHLIEWYRLSEDRTRIVLDWTLDDPDYMSSPLSLTFEWQHSPHIVRQPWSCDSEAAVEYLR